MGYEDTKGQAHKLFCAQRRTSRFASNFCASKKLLKSWSQGEMVGRMGAKLVMKSTRAFNKTVETQKRQKYLPNKIIIPLSWPIL